MGDLHGGPQTSPQHADPHRLGPFLKKTRQEVVLWAGLRVAIWITQVGGKFRHGLLEKS